MLNHYGNTTVVLQPNRKEDNRKEKEEKRIRIKDIYNQNCTNLPQIQKLTEKREKSIDKFLKEFTEEQFIKICQIANSNDFLTGDNERGWKADFDFIMRIDKATAIIEGKYSSKKTENNTKKDNIEEWLNGTS